MIPYSLVRSRRKTVAIHIKKDATVEVRAPLKMPKADIERFVLAKEEWIEKHLNKREQINEAKADYILNYDDMVILGGQLYPICTKDGKRSRFDGERLIIPPGLTPAGIKQAVIKIYKQEIKRIVSEKVNKYSVIMNVSPTAIRITGAKTRWGSCSGKNSINFSWRLAMAEDCVIEYVVVHELAHIKEHNHSARFWAEVEKVLPDYKARQKRLKLLQKELALQDWD
jgi:hypothetical protein